VDIRYEVVLLGQLALRWTEHYRDKQASPSAYQAGSPLCLDYNAVLEAVLVHTRNLLEFLMLANDPGTRSAVQFAPGWDPDEVKARQGLLYGDICGFLSHIAVRRPNPPPPWAVLDVADTVLQEYEAFLGSATQGKVELLREGAAIARSEIASARGIEASLARSARHTP
jgi:hypothetical protein